MAAAQMAWSLFRFLPEERRIRTYKYTGSPASSGDQQAACDASSNHPDRSRGVDWRPLQHDKCKRRQRRIVHDPASNLHANNRSRVDRRPRLSREDNVVIMATVAMPLPVCRYPG